MTKSSENSTTWHPSQKLMAVSGAFLTGVAVASFFSMQERHVYFALILLVGLAAVAGRRKNSIAFLIIGVAFVGGAWRYVQVFNKGDALTGLASKEYITLYGSVDGDFGETQSGRGRFLFHISAIDENGEQQPISGRTMVYTASFPTFAYGEGLKVFGRMQIPETMADFDYPGYLKMQGVGTVMYAQKIEKVSQVVRESSLKNNFWNMAFGMRDRFLESINRSIPEPVASFVAGILVGQRTGISSDMKEAFARTGTSHILAVSGYNITIVAEAILALCILFVRRQKAVWLASGIIIIFMCVSGASASVVRAAIMGILILMATAAGRLSDASISIILAAAVMTWINPLVLKFDIGFQLSFVAVIGLVYVRPLMMYFFKKIPGKTVKEIIATTLSAQVMALPILVYNFELLSPMLIPANLLVLPFLPMVMAFGFFAGTVGLVWSVVGRLIGYWAWAIGMYQLEVIEFFGGLSLAATTVHISILGVWVYYIVVLVALIALRRKYSTDAQ